MGSEHFWKLSFPKFAPRLRARTIRKSKSLKHQGLGTFFEVESLFRVAGAGISTRCKIRGRRRSSSGSQKRWQARWIWRGSETMGFAWQAQGFCGLWCRCLKHSTLKVWKGCKFHVTEVLLCSDHFAWQLQDFVCLGSTFSWQAQYFWSIHLKIIKTYWNSEVKCLLNNAQHVNFEGSLAEMLRFWSSKLRFWRKSRRKASFFISKTCILKEVSQKKLRFWVAKLGFWRKSRRKASFLSFKAWFFKEVSQKCLVFDLQSFIFEGSLAEMLRFWPSKLQFWRKSRRKASFLIFKAAFLKEVSQKSFVFELQSFDFEGSLVEKLRLTKSFESHISWHPNHLNLKSIDNQLIWISNRLITKSLESQISWQPNHLNLKSIDNQITWISNQLRTNSWISNRLTTKSFESQIDWQPNQLNLKSIDNHLTWSSNQQTTKIIWSTHRLTTKSFESQINWQPNHLTLNSFESGINWLSNQLSSTHPLPIGSLSLETSATASCGRYVIGVCRGGVCVTDLRRRLYWCLQRRCCVTDLCRRSYIDVCRGGVCVTDLCRCIYIGVCRGRVCVSGLCRRSYIGVCRGRVCDSDLCRRSYIGVCRGRVCDGDLGRRSYFGVCRAAVCESDLCPRRVLSKSVLQECQVRVSYKSVK